MNDHTRNCRCNDCRHKDALCRSCHQVKRSKGLAYCRKCAEKHGGNKPLRDRRVLERGGGSPVVSGGLPTLGKKRR